MDQSDEEENPYDFVAQYKSKCLLLNVYVPVDICVVQKKIQSLLSQIQAH